MSRVQRHPSTASRTVGFADRTGIEPGSSLVADRHPPHFVEEQAMFGCVEVRITAPQVW
jgi:hypothetical protein